MLWPTAFQPCQKCSLFPLQGLIGKIPEGELNALRMGVPVILSLPCLCFQATRPTVTRELWGITLLFSILYGVQMVTKYTAVNYIPIATATALAMATRMFSCIVLFRIFRHELITISRCMSILLSITGIILMAQPSWLFPSEISGSTINKTYSGYQEQWIGFILIIVSNVLAAIQLLMQRSTQIADVSTWALTWWSFSVG